jgi:3'-phosphoadenosine 5'-phosphosulfate sulfotransferase (PAPS reductase)/FAD synthetase
MAKHTIQELQQWQALPLNVKVLMTKERIREWVNEYGEDGVYVSFSGGKDSTVLLHIAREMYGDAIKGMFVDTGLEYPEIRAFVRTFDNIDIVRPTMTFKQVIEKYGYPFFSKEVCETVYWGRKNVDALVEQWKNDGVEYDDLFEQIKNSDVPVPIRVQMLAGTMKDNEGGKSRYNKTRYRFMLKAPFNIANHCCKINKKEPAHRYSKETGRMPMTAQMASESKLRTQKWLENGCNGFNLRNPLSNPMSFWTDQDVLLYIKTHNIPICPIYGDIVEEDEDAVVGQMRLDDLDPEMFGVFDIGRPILKTTKTDRTGCMFCGFGCHLEKGEGRFEQMKYTHPKQYNYIMKPREEGGLNYKAVIDWINENGGFHIKY